MKDWKNDLDEFFRSKKEEDTKKEEIKE